MKSLPGERYLATFFIIFSVIVLYLSYNISGFKSLYSPGSTPLFTSFILMVFSIRIYRETKTKVNYGYNISIFSLSKLFDFFEISFNISEWDELSAEQLKIEAKFREILDLSKTALGNNQNLIKLANISLDYRLRIKNLGKRKKF